MTATVNQPALLPRQVHRKISQTGFTLLESLIVVAIIAKLSALAAPSFNAAREKKNITGAADAILADLRWARTEAIKRNKTVRITFATGSFWSYTINVDPAGSNTLLKTVNGGDFSSTTLSSAAFAGGVAHTTFSPARGANLNPGTASITSSNFSADLIVSALGRTRICSAMVGYETCS